MKKSTAPQTIVVDNITIEVTRKSVQNFRLQTIPPDGRAVVTAPIGLSDEAIRSLITQNIHKIKQSQAVFAQQKRESEREYVSGESHYFAGRRYLLKVIYHKGKGKVEVRNNKYIDLYVKEGSDRSQREKVMLLWYKEYLKEALPPLIQKWEAIMGVKVSEFKVKLMTQTWGNCYPETGRIGFNTKLAKKNIKCVEYIVVHEMTHLLEASHNKRFHALMTRFLPDWSKRKEELNSML